MAACPSCRSRKGKRACPALRSMICSACCGEKRIVEITCPSDCAYLARGTEHELQREAVEYFQHQDPQKGLRWFQTVERLGFLLEAIERAIAAARTPSLEDADLLVVLECAQKTFDAEAKGVLYEDLPASRSLQALTRELVAGVRYFKEGLDKELAGMEGVPGKDRSPLSQWGPAEAAHCFSVLAERCEYHLKRKQEAGSFLTHLRRIHPPEDREGPQGPARIILA